MQVSATILRFEPERAFERFAAFGDLSEAEARALRRLSGRPVRLEANRDVRGHEQAHAGPLFLDAGWALSSVDLPDGGRQILKVHLPGDILGGPSLPFDGPVETLTTLTPASLSPISLTALGELFVRAPRLGAILFLTAQEERVHLMDRLTAMGRLSAEGSIASLLVHLYDRLVAPGPIDRPAVIDFPMTQPQIGDVLGLTSVHVSRVLGRLERDGRIRREGRTIALLDPARLRRSAGLPRRRLRRDPPWLPAHT